MVYGNIISLVRNWEVYIMFSWETHDHDFVIDFVFWLYEETARFTTDI